MSYSLRPRKRRKPDTPDPGEDDADGPPPPQDAQNESDYAPSDDDAGPPPPQRQPPGRRRRPREEPRAPRPKRGSRPPPPPKKGTKGSQRPAKDVPALPPSKVQNPTGEQEDDENEEGLEKEQAADRDTGWLQSMRELEEKEEAAAERGAKQLGRLLDRSARAWVMHGYQWWEDGFTEDKKVLEAKLRDHPKALERYFANQLKAGYWIKRSQTRASGLPPPTRLNMAQSLYDKFRSELEKPNPNYNNLLVRLGEEVKQENKSLNASGSKVVEFAMRLWLQRALVVVFGRLAGVPPWNLGQAENASSEGLPATPVPLVVAAKDILNERDLIARARAYRTLTAPPGELLAQALAQAWSLGADRSLQLEFDGRLANAYWDRLMQDRGGTPLRFAEKLLRQLVYLGPKRFTAFPVHIATGGYRVPEEANPAKREPLTAEEASRVISLVVDQPWLTLDEVVRELAKDGTGTFAEGSVDRVVSQVQRFLNKIGFRKGVPHELDAKRRTTDANVKQIMDFRHHFMDLVTIGPSEGNADIVFFDETTIGLTQRARRVWQTNVRATLFGSKERLSGDYNMFLSMGIVGGVPFVHYVVYRPQRINGVTVLDIKNQPPVELPETRQEFVDQIALVHVVLEARTRQTASGGKEILADLRVVERIVSVVFPSTEKKGGAEPDTDSSAADDRYLELRASVAEVLESEEAKKVPVDTLRRMVQETTVAEMDAMAKRQGWRGRKLAEVLESLQKKLEKSGALTPEPQTRDVVDELKKAYLERCEELGFEMQDLEAEKLTRKRLAQAAVTGFLGLPTKRSTQFQGDKVKIMGTIGLFMDYFFGTTHKGTTFFPARNAGRQGEWGHGRAPYHLFSTLKQLYASLPASSRKGRPLFVAVDQASLHMAPPGRGTVSEEKLRRNPLYTIMLDHARKELGEGVEARVIYLPAKAPEFNPCERMNNLLKRHLSQNGGTLSRMSESQVEGSLQEFLDKMSATTVINLVRGSGYRLEQDGMVQSYIDGKMVTLPPNETEEELKAKLTRFCNDPHPYVSIPLAGKTHQHHHVACFTREGIPVKYFSPRNVGVNNALDVRLQWVILSKSGTLFENDLVPVYTRLSRNSNKLGAERMESVKKQPVHFMGYNTAAKTAREVTLRRVRNVDSLLARKLSLNLQAPNPVAEVLKSLEQREPVYKGHFYPARMRDGTFTMFPWGQHSSVAYLHPALFWYFFCEAQHDWAGSPWTLHRIKTTGVKTSSLAWRRRPLENGARVWLLLATQFQKSLARSKATTGPPVSLGNVLLKHAIVRRGSAFDHVANAYIAFTNATSAQAKAKEEDDDDTEADGGIRDRSSGREEAALDKWLAMLCNASMKSGESRYGMGIVLYLREDDSLAAIEEDLTVGSQTLESLFTLSAAERAAEREAEREAEEGLGQDMSDTDTEEQSSPKDENEPTTKKEEEGEEEDEPQDPQTDSGTSPAPPRARPPEWEDQDEDQLSPEQWLAQAEGVVEGVRQILSEEPARVFGAGAQRARVLQALFRLQEFTDEFYENSDDIPVKQVSQVLKTLAVWEKRLEERLTELITSVSRALGATNERSAWETLISRAQGPRSIWEGADLAGSPDTPEGSQADGGEAAAAAGDDAMPAAEDDETKTASISGGDTENAENVQHQEEEESMDETRSDDGQGQNQEPPPPPVPEPGSGLASTSQPSVGPAEAPFRFGAARAANEGAMDEEELADSLAENADADEPMQQQGATGGDAPGPAPSTGAKREPSGPTARARVPGAGAEVLRRTIDSLRAKEVTMRTSHARQLEQERRRFKLSEARLLEKIQGVEKNAEALKARADELENSVAFLRGEETRLKEAKSRLQTRIQELQRELRDKNETISRGNAQLAELRQRNEELQQTIAQLRSEAANSVSVLERQRLEARIKELEGVNGRQKGQITTLESELEKQRGRYQELRAEDTKLREERDTLLSQNQALAGRVSQLEGVLNQASSQLEEAKKTAERLRSDELQRAKNEHEQKVQALRLELAQQKAAYDQQLAQATAQLNQGESERAQVAASYEARLEQARNDAAVLQQQISTLKTERDRATASATEANGKVSTLQRSVDEKEAEIADLQQEVNDVYELLRRAQQEGASREEVQALEAELEGAQASLAEAQRELQNAQGALDQAQREKASLRELAEKAQDRIAELEAAQKNHQATVAALQAQVSGLQEQNSLLEAQREQTTAKIAGLQSTIASLQAKEAETAAKMDELYNDLTEAATRDVDKADAIVKLNQKIKQDAAEIASGLAQLKKIQDDLSKAEARLQAETEKSTRLAQEKETLAAQVDAGFKEKEKQLQALHDQQIAQVKSKYEARLKKEESKNAEGLARAKSEYEGQIKTLKEQHAREKSDLERKRAELQAEIDKMAIADLDIMEKTERLEKAVAALTEQSQNLKDKLANAQAEKTEAERRLDEKINEIEEEWRKSEQAKEKFKELHREKLELQEKINQAALKEQEGQWKTQDLLRKVKKLKEARQVAELGRTRAKAFARANADSVKKLKQDVTALEAQKKELEGEIQALKDAADPNSERILRLLSSENEKGGEIESLRYEVEDLNEKIARLKGLLRQAGVADELQETPPEDPSDDPLEPDDQAGVADELQETPPEDPSDDPLEPDDQAEPRQESTFDQDQPGRAYVETSSKRRKLADGGPSRTYFVYQYDESEDQEIREIKKKSKR